MIIKTFTGGMLENENYLLIDEISKDAILIDCTEFYPEINETLKKYNANLKYVLLTHGHFDHILGLNELHEQLPDVEIFAHKDDAELINDVGCFVDRFIGGLGKISVPPITKYIDENEKILLGNDVFKIFHTPGHTKGGVCYLIGDKLFSGDTIFMGSVGRTDLPGGNYEQIKTSVSTVLNNLDDNVQILPGHGPATNVKYEKDNNPVL